VFRKDMTPLLWAVRPNPRAKKILIIEGTKQTLAAATHAPAEVAVYGIAGCRSWQVNGQPIPDLATADGREVVVILDADAAENPQVYQAGVELAAALELEGATRITFARLPGGGTSGLDDILAGRPADRRQTYLAALITGAKPKPADAKPKPKRKGSGEPGGDDGRVTIICNRDRFDVINDITDAMLKRWNAVELFCHGGVISRRKTSGMSPVDRGSFYDLIQETARTVNENEGANGTTYSFAWPDPNSTAAVLSRAEQFATLDRVSHAPFVREDGTVVTEPGYDKATRTMLVPDPVFESLTVPEQPTGEQIAAARELLLTEWLGDFPFESDVDRANMLALLVTPAIRGMVPKVPLAVVDGLQMGVGKNLLADSLLTVYTGSAAEPMNWVSEAEELRKQITSAFRAGSEFFVFDEAHTIEGAPLAQALTAATWQDRILGVSTMANFPNRVTWISLGNNVQVKGDLTRRVYRIALRPNYANPQDRDANSFRHPGRSGYDLLTWTRLHRAEIMTAILTLVRAWFAIGQPRPVRGISFGSFEIWEKITGGIVETAGLTGFLDNIKTWRSESDFDTQYWYGHLRWLREQFGDDPFRTAEVRGKALTDVAGYLAPPKLDDPAEKGYGKALGEAYSRLRGRRYETLWIERSGFAHGHVSTWQVHEEGDGPTEGNPDPEPMPGPVETESDETACRCQLADEIQPGCPVHDTQVSTSQPVEEPVDKPSAIVHLGAPGMLGEMERALAAEGLDVNGEPMDKPSAELVTFDLETGDATELYTTPGDRYIRIGGTATDGGPVQVFDGDNSRDVAEDVAARFWGAEMITGHNIMAFDFPALVRAGVLTMPELHRMAADGKLFDAMLVARYLDPPMAKSTGVDHQRKYDLGNLLAKHGLSEKLSDVSAALKKKYGGWGNIPIDDSEDGQAFKAYLTADVEGSRQLYRVLISELGGTMPDYLVREHRVAAIAAQISHNGFLVDQELLAERVAGVEERKSESLTWLNEHAGIPLTNTKGELAKSPLATAAGKDALEAALKAAGVTSLWRTPNGGLSTNGDHMRHLAQEYHHLPQVREIAKAVYRIVGARSVYQTAQDHLCPDGRVHTKIGFEQATGRWSVTRPGLTVFGKRGGRHVERAVFLPDPGEVLIAVDLSQVDMRAVAGLSQDQAYIDMLRTDDPHTELAVALFGDAGFREQAKAIGHGWNYGESLKRISEENDISPEIVRRFDTSMKERFPRLVEWREEVRAIAGAGELLDNGFGRMMRADPARAHTQAPALKGQGAARDLMMEGLIRLPAEILPMLRAQIHDEVVASVPVDRAEEIGRVIVDAFTFEWKGVPILADSGPTGTDWSRCYMKP
jgi:DNA polymerase I-like protein with 3'-5' exonuclease and polymerase domains